VARRLGLPDAGLVKYDRYTEGLVDLLLDATINYDQKITICDLIIGGIYVTGIEESDY
jgi:hypothetical protein